MNESFVADVDELLSNTRQTLLGMRGDHGHWEGELSSSALSTATAVMAIGEYLNAGEHSHPPVERELLQRLVDRGLSWLAETQLDDGGWGDTVLSIANISTTALVWGAFSQSESRYRDVVSRCETWLQRTAGSLESKPLAEAITHRYGKDRTFSVPILTTLAIRNRLGEPAAAWKLVPQLPFELAACPHQWFARLKLPVVSYALPALVAMGQVRHDRRPSANPLLRILRNRLRRRTLDVLTSIQPTSGGFLEATPLTSFVMLSLIHAGLHDHDVVKRGLAFLIRSAREEGSWPIDTNLSTWVTTLSINALCARGTIENELNTAETSQILNWLTGQQYQVEHPYTHAAPGAWAWTDLTGGVPDADDTPGALLALYHLAGPNDSTTKAAAAGITWLLDVQNSDGGIPTFCKGWGTLPFDRSSADLTAHALRAWNRWHDHLPRTLQIRIHHGMAAGLKFLKKKQRPDGAWAPLWFGNQFAPDEENLTYGTSRVLLALTRIGHANSESPDVATGRQWLFDTQNDDGGWGGAPQTPSSIEETALSLEALAADSSKDFTEAESAAIQRGIRWLIERTNKGREFPPSPIGFYFAKLWYYEQLYPIVYTLAAAGRIRGWLDQKQLPVITTKNVI
ncbi:MAG: squalene--hopene cyclase [Planctomycetota bacterium]|nr:squalene--hopene cyclase [Planctomycetota bacterium]MDA1212954.1 squalene--hopene cyclase [Planctomycetota bacterium]